MAERLSVALIDRVRELVRGLATDHARRLAHLHYADIRLEVSEGKAATAENGAAKLSSDDYGFAVGIRVLAGAGTVAAGHFGRTLGVADAARLERILREGIEHAYRRALANSEFKADAREKFGTLGQALADTRLCPIDVRQDQVPAPHQVETGSAAGQARQTD